MSIQYKLHTKSNGTLTANHVESPPSNLNTTTHGGSTTITCHFSGGPSGEELTIPSGDTYTIPAGTTEQYASVTVAGVLVVEGTLLVDWSVTTESTGTITQTDTGTITQTAAVGDREVLMGYDRHAGSYTINGTLNNQQRYRLTIPDNANINSLLIGVEPSEELKNRGIRGFWGLLRNVVDGRTPALTHPVIELEVDILAAFSEYADISSVEAALEV